MNDHRPASETVITIQRTFAAPRERVFRAWIQPQAIERWFRPMGQPSRVVTLDLRVGGDYRIELLYASGESSFISGQYLEIAPPERLVFTWRSAGTDDRETLVTVEFVEQGSATEVILTHERLSGDEMIANHQAGWHSVLDQLSDECEQEVL